jgi:amino acid transporter
MKLAPHLVFLVAVVLGMVGHIKNTIFLLNAGWLGSIAGLIFTYFLMMFNTRTASQVICDEWEDVCLDEAVGACDTDLEAYQGFLYILGLCFLIIGGSLGILFFLERAMELRKIAVGE